MRGLYAILDARTLGKRNPLEAARAVIQGGARAIQYRAKNVPDGKFYQVCRRLAVLCARNHIPVIVNDRCDIAVSAGAHGVHLGHEDLPVQAARKIVGPGRIIGVSSHSVKEALKNEAILMKGDRSCLRHSRGYVGLGPVYRSKTKCTRRRLLGTRGVRQAGKRLALPLVAIGGITRDNAGQTIRAGAGAVAVVHDILGSNRPARSARQLVRIIQRQAQGQE